jgi:hypothetical protein
LIQTDETKPPRPRFTALPWLLLATALVPGLVVVWTHPCLVTQDGPAHHYNAHILARSFDPNSPYRAIFAVRWEALPNWAGHLVMMALDGALPPRLADRAMTTLTAVALAASVFGLRLKVVGTAGAGAAAIISAMIGLNVAWLLGLSSFLLGASLFATKGIIIKLALLALLVALGYFSHLVSLGLTIVGVLVLELATPSRDRLGRLATTMAGLAPALPLGWVYLGLMRRGGGGFAPEWKHLADPFSVRSWATQFTWADPISLARKDYLPLAGSLASWHLACAPVLWLGAALGLAVLASWRAGRGPLADPERRGWWVLASSLLLAGAAGPDTLGASHGEYLPLRILLLGLAALVPVLSFQGVGRASIPAAMIALAFQTATLWDYAETSERTAGAILRSGATIGNNQRIVTRLTDIRTPFRANPLLHADCALGIGTGNIVWSDYETRFYYFPVQFRDGLDHPDPWELERIALGAANDPARRALWEAILKRHHPVIDRVVTWGADPALDAETARWFHPDRTVEEVTIWRRADTREE